MVLLKAVCYQRVAVAVAVTHAYHNVFYWHKNGTLLIETKHSQATVYTFSLVQVKFGSLRLCKGR